MTIRDEISETADLINSAIEKFTALFEDSDINYVLHLSEKTLKGFFDYEKPLYSTKNKIKGHKTMPQINFKGKIVLIPFTGTKGKKLIPALVLGETKEICIVAFISGKEKYRENVFCVPLIPGDENFNKTGLKGPSYICLDKTASLLKEMISMQLGEIDGIYKETINKKIETLFYL